MKKIITLVMVTICLQFVAGEGDEIAPIDGFLAGECVQRGTITIRGEEVVALLAEGLSTGENVQEGTCTTIGEVIAHIQIAFNYYLEMKGSAKNSSLDPERSDISYHEFEYTTQSGHNFIMIYIGYDYSKILILGGDAFVILDPYRKEVVYFRDFK